MNEEMMEILGIDEAVRIIEEKTGEGIDINKNAYVLKTPGSYLVLALNDDDENPGKRKLDVSITGGNIVMVETDEMPLAKIFGEES